MITGALIYSLHEQDTVACIDWTGVSYMPCKRPKRLIVLIL
jgi:hypothetical protein